MLGLVEFFEFQLVRLSRIDGRNLSFIGEFGRVKEMGF